MCGGACPGSERGRRCGEGSFAQRLKETTYPERGGAPRPVPGTPGEELGIPPRWAAGRRPDSAGEPAADPKTGLAWGAGSRGQGGVTGVLRGAKAGQGQTGAPPPGEGAGARLPGVPPFPLARRRPAPVPRRSQHPDQSPAQVPGRPGPPRAPPPRPTRRPGEVDSGAARVRGRVLRAGCVPLLRVCRASPARPSPGAGVVQAAGGWAGPPTARGARERAAPARGQRAAGREVGATCEPAGRAGGAGLQRAGGRPAPELGGWDLAPAQPAGKKNPSTGRAGRAGRGHFPGRSSRGGAEVSGFSPEDTWGPGCCCLWCVCGGGAGRGREGRRQRRTDTLDTGEQRSKGGSQ